MSGYPPEVLYQEYFIIFVRFGTPLWNPIPDDGHVKIGDVGFMANGSFSRLLRATASPAQLEELGDRTPAGFEQLQLSESDIRMNIRISYPIYSTTMTSSSISGSASVGSVPVSEVTGASIDFEFSQGKCALFLTRHGSHCQNSIQVGTLKDYVKKHYRSWLHLARDRGYDDVRPILVSGFASSQDYAMMTYAANDNQISASVTVNVPNVGSFWGNAWATCTSRGSPHYNCGPQPTESNSRRLEQGSSSEPATQLVRSTSGTSVWNAMSLFFRSESNNRRLEQQSPSEAAAPTAQNRYVTFVKGWYMEYRLYILTRMKAAAEPKDLDPEDQDPECGAEVLSNVASENINPLDVVFKFLFQNSTADYALIHDDDLRPISEIAFRCKESIGDVLERCPPSVVLMDNDGVASFMLEHLISWSKDAPEETPLSSKEKEMSDNIGEGFVDTEKIGSFDPYDSEFFSNPAVSNVRSLVDEWNFIERLQQSMRTSGASASADSDAEGFHNPKIGSSVQMLSDMEALTRRLEKQEDELKKLRSSAVQMVNEMENLKWRLYDKDEEIRRLNRESSETVTEVGVLTQHLREKDGEIKRLQGGSPPVASESGAMSSRVKKFSIDLKSSRKRASLIRGHKGIVHSVAFSPDGQCIASGGEDYMIRVWDTHSGKNVLGPLRGHVADVKSVAFSPDSSRIVSGGEDRLVNVWDAHTGAKLLGPLTGHDDWVRSVQFSPDGSSIFSGSWDGTVYVWDAMTGAKIKGPSAHQGGVLSITFSPDGTRIVSGGVTGNSICVWDDTTGNMILGPLLHPGWVRGVAYSPDGTMIVSGCKDGNVRLWDATTGALLLGPLTGEPVNYVRSVAFSPDGTRIASAGRGKTIHVWDALSGKQLTGTTRKHASDVWSVVFSPDGEWIASGGEDGMIRVWPGK